MPGKTETPRETSNLRAPLTRNELRELIEERAWLRARRAGRSRWTNEEWRTAEAEVLRRIGAES